MQQSDLFRRGIPSLWLWGAGYAGSQFDSDSGGIRAVSGIEGRGQSAASRRESEKVIFLYQAGGPSHLETFDFKPKLAALDGRAMPESMTRCQQIPQLQGKELMCFGPQHEFRRLERTEKCCVRSSRIGRVVDDLCIVRSMTTEQINHDPAHTIMNTGSIIPGRPSMGSWTVYGLGSEAENLPGFVVLMSSGKGGQMQPIAARQWSAGFRCCISIIRRESAVSCSANRSMP